MKKSFIPLFAMLLTLCCCPYSLIANDLTTQKPSDLEIVGTYRVTAQNLDTNGLKAFQNRQPQLIFNVDGSCVVSDFPVWEENTSSFKINAWLSFDGKWAIVNDGSVRRGGKTYDVWGIRCNSNIETMGTGEFTGTKPPYDVVFIYGDPDSDNAMTFSKMP